MRVVVVPVLVISIHALREESDLKTSHQPTVQQNISIHALREESDCKRRQNLRDYPISIHALREESDLFARKY